MDVPVTVIKNTFQEAWIEVAKALCEHTWNIQNLMVSIQKPDLIDDELHKKFIEFAESHDLIKPKDVAYTIFPHIKR